MEQSTNEQSVRESRRRAAVAIAVVEQHTGPIKKILGLTRNHSWAALSIALVAGLIVGRILRRN